MTNSQKITDKSAVYLDSLALLKKYSMVPADGSADEFIKFLGPEGVVNQAKAFSETLHQQDISVKKTKAKGTFEATGKSLTATTKAYKAALMAKVRSEIGTSPSKSYTLCSIPLNDGNNLSVKFNAVLKNPDNSDRKEQIKLENDLVSAFEGAIEAIGLSTVADAMRLEAGTKDTKSVTLLKSSVDEYNVNVGLSISKSANKADTVVEL